MARLTLTLFGSFQVTIDDRSVTEFATDRARALLAYLAVERDRPHRREALAALLWPDQPEERARQSFRQALSHLRQALCDSKASCPFLLVERNEVQLNPDADVYLDVADFTKLADTCDSHRHRSRKLCLPCLHRSEAMLALYRGEFLAGSLLADSQLFEEWALLKREWLHARAVECMAQLADFYEHRGDVVKASRYVQQQVQLEPWREEAHRQLMRLLILANQRSAALAQYEMCRRILQAEFGVEPAAETRQLWAQIRAGATGNTGAGEQSEHGRLSRRRRLPTSPSPFVGRETELRDLTELLANPDCRLVTLTGPGGIGKTRLALQLAEDHVGLYTHGVFWVALDEVQATELIVPTIAQSLGFTLYEKEPPQAQLLNYLREKTLLLVLDNAEALPGLSEIVEDLLRHAPNLTFVVTSRARLALREEWVFAVEGMPYPDALSPQGMGEDVTHADAITLFLQHARRVHRKFSPGQDELAAIVEICRLVEGMPLALELAAAWVSEQPCAVIARELEVGLDLLRATVRNVPERQRSARATFEHSWAMLPDAERRFLARLSVFRAGFTAEAAREVAEVSPESLSDLVTRSLVRKLPTGRYRLHELLRQFAEEKLGASDGKGADDPQGPAARHAAYYAGFLADREPALKGTGQEDALSSITVEIANARRAWEWAITALEQTTAPEVALDVCQRATEGLFVFYALRSWYHEGAAAYARAASAVGDRAPLLLGKLLTRQARCLEFTAPAEEATALYRRSLEIFTDLGAEHEMALPLYGLGYMAHIRGEYESARRYLTASAERCEAVGDRWGLANALSSLCLSVRRQGAFEEARRFGLESLAIRRDLGDRRGIASSQNNVGLVLCAQGEYTAAEVALRESLDICREIGHTVGAANALTSLSMVGLGDGDVEKARSYQGEALELFREVGDLWGVAVSLNNLGQLSLERDDPSTAQPLLREAVILYRQVGIKAGLTNALSNLARADEMMEAYAEAAQHFHEALTLATEIDDLPFGLEVLARATALLARQCAAKRSCRTDELLTVLTVVLHHPALLEETRRAALELEARLRAESPTPAGADATAVLDYQAAATAVFAMLDELLHPTARKRAQGQPPIEQGLPGSQRRLR